MKNPSSPSIRFSDIGQLAAIGLVALYLFRQKVSPEFKISLALTFLAIIIAHSIFQWKHRKRTPKVVIGAVIVISLLQVLVRPSDLNILIFFLAVLFSVVILIVERRWRTSETSPRKN